MHVCTSYAHVYSDRAERYRYPHSTGKPFFFLNVYILFCGIVAFRKRRCGGASVDKKLGHLTSSVCVYFAVERFYPFLFFH